MVEEMLDTPPAWTDVPDLMMESKDGRMMPEAATKRKRDEVARGWRKRWREDDIRLEKRENYPMASMRTCNPAGFYSEEWDKLQQEDDDWQVADKWQRIARIVFCSGCLEIHPSGSGYISRSCTQHQRGGCSTCDWWVDQKGRTNKRSMKHQPSTMQGGEDYTVNALYLAEREMKKLFNEDR